MARAHEIALDFTTSPVCLAGNGDSSPMSLIIALASAFLAAVPVTLANPADARAVLAAEAPLIAQTDATLVIDAAFGARMRAAGPAVQLPALELGDGSMVTLQLERFQVVDPLIEVRLCGKTAPNLADAQRAALPRYGDRRARVSCVPRRQRSRCSGNHRSRRWPRSSHVAINHGHGSRSRIGSGTLRRLHRHQRT